MSISPADLKELLSRALAATSEPSLELTLEHLAPEAAHRLRLCAIPHTFDAPLLQALVPGLSEEEAERQCEDFSQLAIVGAHEDGLALQDPVRERLFGQWLEPSNSQEFQAVSGRLVAYFDGLVLRATGERRTLLERRKMFHELGALPGRGFREFERLFQLAWRTLRLGECDTLCLLVHEYDAVLSRAHATRLAYHEAKLAMEHGQPERTRSLLEQVLADEALPEALRVRALRRLGMLAANQREWEKALTHFEEALQRVGASPWEVYPRERLLLEKALAYRDSGRSREAIPLLQESVEGARVRGDPRQVAITYNSLGMVHHRLGELREAIEAYEESLRHIPEEDVLRRAQVTGNLGAVYADLREWPRSEQLLQGSLALAGRGGDVRAQAQALNNLVRVYQNLGWPERAIQASRDSVTHFKELRDVRAAAIVQRNLAKLYSGEGDREQARHAYEDALRLFTRCRDTAELEMTQKEFQALEHKPRAPWWWWMGLVFAVLLAVFVLTVMVILLWRPDLL